MGEYSHNDTTPTSAGQLPQDTDTARSGRRAAVWALSFAAVTYVVLFLTLGQRLEGTAGYVGGYLAVPCVAAAGLMVVVAHSSQRPLPWWIHALAVPVVAAGLALAMSWNDVVKEPHDREAATPSGRGGDDTMQGSQQPGDPVPDLLKAPGSGAGWTVLDTRQTRAEVRRISEGMEGAAGGDLDSVVAAFYTHTSAPETPVLFVGLNGEMDPDTSYEQSLVNLLAGGSVTDPESFETGQVDGALGCGEAEAQGAEWVSCAWAGQSRAVLVRWNDAAVSLDTAAELTRDLRDRALH